MAPHNLWTSRMKAEVQPRIEDDWKTEYFFWLAPYNILISVRGLQVFWLVSDVRRCPASVLTGVRGLQVPAGILTGIRGMQVPCRCPVGALQASWPESVRLQKSAYWVFWPTVSQGALLGDTLFAPTCPIEKVTPWEGFHRDLKPSDHLFANHVSELQYYFYTSLYA